MNRTDDEYAVDLPGDVRMPLVGLGTWHLRGEEGYVAVRDALELGYRHLDTAAQYGNETEVGRAVQDSGVPREDVFITTKLPPGRAGQERRTITESLRALDTEYVDLWLIHWPPGGAAMPETWRGLIAARDDGLTRAIGVSNYSLAQLDELTEATGETPAVNQIRWSPPLHDPVVLDGHRERQVVLEGYSPFKDTDLDHPALKRIADVHGVTTAQVVIRWHIEHRIVAIPKSARRERLATNFDVFDFSLDPSERDEIDLLSRGS